MRALLVVAASLGFSIAAASACDFHNTTASTQADTDQVTVASIDSTVPMSKATGEAAAKLAHPDQNAPAPKAEDATE